MTDLNDTDNYTTFDLFRETIDVNYHFNLNCQPSELSHYLGTSHKIILRILCDIGNNGRSAILTRILYFSYPRTPSPDEIKLEITFMNDIKHISVKKFSGEDVRACLFCQNKQQK